MTDGKVFAAMGSPTKAPKVERVSPPGTAGVIRLRIQLPSDYAVGDNITLVYSDSDDGKTQKRLIATSNVRLGWAATLGTSRVIDQREATCVVEGGRLTRKLSPQKFDPDKPVFEF